MAVHVQLDRPWRCALNSWMRMASHGQCCH